MDRETFVAYVLPAALALLSALAGWIGLQLKDIYQKHVNDKTKQAVVRTCVKAVEQLYRDLDGPTKLKKAQEGIVAMLGEKGIPISELEMNALIEACVSEFNHGFGFERVAEAVVPGISEETICTEYSEEEGASL